MHTYRWQIRVIQLLAIPGLMLSYYLWLYHAGYIQANCTVTEFFDCGRVSGPTAQYSSLGSIPIALIGLVGYGAIFLVIWLADFAPLLDAYLPKIILILTGIALLFTLFLKSLELFVISAVCQYCLYSAGIVAVMFGLALSSVLFAKRALESKKKNLSHSMADNHF